MRTKPKSDPLLRLWGRYYGERAPQEWDEASDIAPGPLARAIDYHGGDLAPHRSARGALRLRNAGVKSARVQSWGFDPIGAHESRTFKISTPDDVPRDVQRVQDLALELYRIDTLRGIALRMEYCTRGPQVEKAARMALHGFPMRMGQYREAVNYAIGWMESRLSQFELHPLAFGIRIDKTKHTG